jgi:hypothetical protein
MIFLSCDLVTLMKNIKIIYIMSESHRGRVGPANLDGLNIVNKIILSAPHSLPLPPTSNGRHCKSVSDYLLQVISG